MYNIFHFSFGYPKPESLTLSLLEFQIMYLAFFCLFLVIDGFEWIWMGIFYNNIQSILYFLKAPFLVLRFPTMINVINVIYKIAIYVYDTLLYSKCD